MEAKVYEPTEYESYDEAKTACDVKANCWGFMELVESGPMKPIFKLCSEEAITSKNVGIYYSEFSSLHYGILIEVVFNFSNLRRCIIFEKYLAKNISTFFRF